MIEKLLKTFPPVILFEGCLFKFNLMHGVDFFAISYDLIEKFYSSPHYNSHPDVKYWQNRFLKPTESPEELYCCYLYLSKRIRNDDNLESAMAEFSEFIYINKIPVK